MRPMRWAPARFMRSSFHCFSSAPSGTAAPGCARSLPTNPSSDIDMYRMTSRMNASRCSYWFRWRQVPVALITRQDPGRVSSAIGQDAVGEVLRARCHLGFEQLEAHRRVAREEWSAATEDEGRHMDGHYVDET